VYPLLCPYIQLQKFQKIKAEPIASSFETIEACRCRFSEGFLVATVPSRATSILTQRSPVFDSASNRASRFVKFEMLNTFFLQLRQVLARSLPDILSQETRHGDSIWNIVLIESQSSLDAAMQLRLLIATNLSLDGSA